MTTLKLAKETKDAMIILDIKEFPFSAGDLHDAFRNMAKIHHPDNQDTGDVDCFRLVQESFQRLTPLADLGAVSLSSLKDPNAVYETCPACYGEKGELITIKDPNQTDVCPSCEGKGYHPVLCDQCDDDGMFTLKERPCRACDDNGMFLQKNGRTVVCRACGGTKKIRPKTVCRNCKGKKVLSKPYCKTCGGEGHVPVYVEKWADCKRCAGLGEVKLELFNPVIVKNGVLV